MNYNKILISFWLVFSITFDTTAQDNESDKLGTQEVTVVKSYSPSLKSVFKIRTYPKIDDSLIQKKINIFGTLFFGMPLSLILISNGFDYFYRSFLQNESSKETGGLPFIFILKFFILLMGIFLFFELFRQTLNFLREKK